jgi:hypothetical protein
MNNPFRVPKTPVEVEVALVGSRPEEVELFVSDVGSGPDTALIKLIDETQAFLPARKGEGSWTLINTANLMWLSVASPPTSTRLQMFDQRAFVQATMIDGSTVQGELLYTPPSTHGRVADHLGRPERLFTLHRRARVLIVNKAFVATLSEIDTLTPTQGL